MQSNEFSKMTHHEFDQTRTGWRKFGDDHKSSIKAIFQFAKEKIFPVRIEDLQGNILWQNKK